MLYRTGWIYIPFPLWQYNSIKAKCGLSLTSRTFFEIFCFVCSALGGSSEVIVRRKEGREEEEETRNKNFKEAQSAPASIS